MVGYLGGSGRRVRLLDPLCCRAESRSEIVRLGGDGMGSTFLVSGSRGDRTIS